MIRAHGKATRKGNGGYQLIEALKRAGHATVTVGVHEDAGTYASGHAVGTVAAWNEFGTVRTPERSFMRRTLYERSGDVDRWRQEALERLVKGWPTERALAYIGLRIVEAIRTTIRKRVPPPLSPRYLARKKAKGEPPGTLIATGLLLRSIGFRVTGAQAAGPAKAGH